MNPAAGLGTKVKARVYQAVGKVCLIHETDMPARSRVCRYRARTLKSIGEAEYSAGPR